MCVCEYIKRDYLSEKQIFLYDEILDALKIHEVKGVYTELEEQEIEEVVNTIVRDYPEYAFAWKDNCKLVPHESNKGRIVKIEYLYTKSKTNVVRHSIDTYICENIIPYVKNAKCKTEKDIVTAIYKYLAGVFTWAEQVKTKNGECEFPHYAYTLETLEQLKGVCQGIALSLIYILRKYEIECFYIRGRTDTDAPEENNGAPTHGWCMVKLDGSYYHLDLAWDLKAQEFQYFLLTDAEMYMRHHRWDYTAYPKAG